jgi:hypothetical protein
MSATPAKPKPAYRGKITRVGDSKGVRLDAAFFRAHPELSADVSATVVAEGRVLLSARNPVRPPASRPEAVDPVMLAFLRFLEGEMLAHPETLVPADPGQLKRMARLVDGVDAE